MLEVTGIPPILKYDSKVPEWSVLASCAPHPCLNLGPSLTAECERVNNTPLCFRAPNYLKTTEPQNHSLSTFDDDENISCSECSSQLKAAPPSAVMAADSQRPSVCEGGGGTLKTLLPSDNKDPPNGSGHRTDQSHFRPEHRKEDL